MNAEQLWERVQGRQGLLLPPDPALRASVDKVIRAGDFRSIAELPEVEQFQLTLDLRALAHSALELAEPVDIAVRKLSFQRFLRVGGLFVLLSALAAGTAVGVDRLTQKPNLVLGKPWRTSSVWGVCKPEIRTCGGLRTDIFFHTNEDATPWIEFDLGVPTRFSEVFVKNRTDSTPDRAVPLLLEVSDDREKWREIARQEESFRTWTASFAPVTARYARLRVNRRSYLHLEKVELHP